MGKEKYLMRAKAIIRIRAGRKGFMITGHGILPASMVGYRRRLHKTIPYRVVRDFLPHKKFNMGILVWLLAILVVVGVWIYLICQP